MKHVHVAKYDEETGKLLDACKECGKGIRDLSVHYTSEEFFGRTRSSAKEERRGK